jgi:FkbM family methyltransferase
MLIDFNNIVRKYGKPNGILHVGANTGQEAEAYDKAGVKNVVWIEALPHIYEQLLMNVKQYGHICIKACVSDVDGSIVEFHESNNEAQSSSFLELGTHKTAHPEVHYIRSHRMTTMRLDTILDNTEIIDFGHGLDMLVMDIQGAEMLALKGLGARIEQFNKVYLEVNTKEVYKGCSLLPEFDKYFKALGFRKADEKIFQHWGWGDCLWIK